MVWRCSAPMASSGDAECEKPGRGRLRPPPGDRHLSAHRVVPRIRAIRAHIADAPRGRLDSLEHRGRMWTPQQSRAAFVSLHRVGIGERARLPASDRDRAESWRGPFGRQTRRRSATPSQNVESPDRLPSRPTSVETESGSPLMVTLPQFALHRVQHHSPLHPLTASPTHRTATSLHAPPSRRSVAAKLTGWRSVRPAEPSYS